MKTKETKNKVLAIALFYVIAVIIRAIVLKYEDVQSGDLAYWLWGWAGGIGPCLGAIAAVLLFKRKFYCTITGTSVVKSALMIVIPFTICFFLDMKIGFTWLGFVVYSFLEEVGWRGYLQGELKEVNHGLRVLIITTMWFFWHVQIVFSFDALIFFVILLLGSWGIGILARDTHSLITCACLHTLGNFSLHGFFEFTPSIIALYVAIFIIWHLIWYVPWKNLYQRLAI